MIPCRHCLVPQRGFAGLAAHMRAAHHVQDPGSGVEGVVALEEAREEVEAARGRWCLKEGPGEA